MSTPAPGERATRALAPRRRPRRGPRAPGWILASLLALGCPGDGEAPAGGSSREGVAPGTLPRIVSLARAAARLGVPVETWTLDLDTRRTVVLEPGRPLLLPGLPLGPSCTLRFGLGLPPKGWNGWSAVRTHVEAVRDGERRPLLQSDFDPRVHPAARWSEHAIGLGEVPLPAGEWTLELRVDAPDAGRGRSAPPRVGVGTPWLQCSDAAPEAASPGRPHVILVSLDTLRADHLGIHGYQRATSPAIDRFAAGATVFENAFATAPWTLPSHASMFTGLYPAAHGGGHRAPFVPLPADGPPTLAERLGDAGYHTLAFTAAGVVSRAQGLARGFADWNEWARVNLRSVVPEVLDAFASARRAEPEQPVFLFLHTYDIHGPYEVPRDYRRRPRPLPPASEAARARWSRQQQMPHHRYLRLEQYQGAAQVIDAYDAGIRFVDAQLSLFFDTLEARGWLDDALVILTSDHGEAFLEHGLYIGHSYTLFDEELHVPLVVRTPGQEEPGRSEGLVDLTDLVPLILETVGLAVPETLAGSNPLTRPPRSSVRAEAAHSGSSALRSGRWKVVSAPFPFDDPRMRVSRELADDFATGPLVFDLAADPREMSNRGTQDLPPEAGALLERVNALERPGLDSGRYSVETASELDESFVGQLRALGYLDAEEPGARDTQGAQEQP